MTNPASLYSIDSSSGWRTYHIDQFQKEQCDVIASSCKEEALFERYKAVALAVGGVLCGTVFVFVCFALAKAAVPFFVGMATAAGCETPNAILFVARVFSYTVTYIIGLVVLKKIWDKSNLAVADHWKYANHLNQQAVDVLLHKAKPVNPPAAPKPEPSNNNNQA